MAKLQQFDNNINWDEFASSPSSFGRPLYLSNKQQVSAERRKRSNGGNCQLELEKAETETTSASFHSFSKGQLDLSLSFIREFPFNFIRDFAGLNSCKLQNN